jgi:chromosome segregation ATPase
MDNLEWLQRRRSNHFSGSPQRDPIDAISRFSSVDSASAAPDGRLALDLVYQAATVVRSLEDRANEFGIHAREMAEKAVEKLKLADKRIQELENQQREVEACLNEARIKLQKAGEALQTERARVLATESKLPELEQRARSAEARANECEKTLARIEDAIRTEILRQGPAASSRSSAAA